MLQAPDKARHGALKSMQETCSSLPAWPQPDENPASRLDCKRTPPLPTCVADLLAGHQRVYSMNSDAAAHVAVGSVSPADAQAQDVTAWIASTARCFQRHVLSHKEHTADV